MDPRRQVLRHAGQLQQPHLLRRLRQLRDGRRPQELLHRSVRHASGQGATLLPGHVVPHERAKGNLIHGKIKIN